MAVNEKYDTYLGPAGFIIRPVPFGATWLRWGRRFDLDEDGGEVVAVPPCVLHADERLPRINDGDGGVTPGGRAWGRPSWPGRPG
jgi:hypothetical protein